jgi:hypothetical protein
MSLRMLISACRINPDTGRSHLMQFLEMGAKVKSEEDITEETFGDTDAPRVMFVEYEEGHAPYSEHHVIEVLANEILTMRGLDPA